ncbi:MAG: 50S ribosomal protein L32 [Alphaproteobacteria bacterium RIFCSPLOWO2_01_FULL_45_8]|nr:MAG: 50S ribosomal protein L32 [Alphaproteobacteria bacterium GWA1_45_9]OFW89850.1 MAG: 50S ribosomal protein L32 [Alphaproteobacteria bacterium RIFCSPHIGHO2_01_FULL_41_14]OFW96050.1 MAG: 50S ribosomal protein L32 [Alphaproteobacteria bacterium RIFCSPLOWO2_01_FULL_45_8]HCI48983.1 50S ribosomal protein L32 [Holosporales bacterium]
MAVPKKKTSTSRRDQRRAHDFLKVVSHAECQNCGEIIRPHHLCTACGHYGSKEVIEQRPAAEDTEETTKQ